MIEVTKREVRVKNHLAILFIVMFVVGCATISDQAKYQLEKPVDCSTARYDIKTLESEKASVGKRMLSGVKMVVPASAVIGILRGDWVNRKKVATGEYNRAIDDKIVDIKSSCGIY